MHTNAKKTAPKRAGAHVVRKRTARSGAIKTSVARSATSGQYTGRWAKIGNSDGFRIEKRLFKEHPEFSSSEVRVKYISPGKLLLEAEGPVENKDDVVMTTFLSFLDDQMLQNPQDIVPMDQNLLDQIGDLVDGVSDT